MSALESLYEWFKRQLSRTADSSGEMGAGAPIDAEGEMMADVVTTQKAFVQDQIEVILKTLGAPPSVESRVVTVRKRFCEIHRYLRPVYAEPTDLNRHLTQADQQTPFNIEFEDDDDRVFAAIPGHMWRRNEQTILCIHRVPDTPNGHATADAKTVAQRLTRFWQNNLMGARKGKKPGGYEFSKRVDGLNRLKQGPGKALFCIFAGSLGPADKRKKRKLKALFGVYLVLSEDWAPDQNIDQALEDAADLFRGLDFISQMDSRLFELQGLRRMANLLHRFGNEDSPRSDKISAALEDLNAQLNQHLVGRPDWEGGDEPKLFYLSASFERVEQGWFPRLEVYPHAYRDKFPLVSLLVNHARVPSTSKFLLKTYLDQHWNEFSMAQGTEVPLDPRFTDLFKAENLGIPEVEEWQDRVMRGDQSTCLHMVGHDEVIDKLVAKGKKGPWQELNHSVDPSGTPSRSLLAFVIEGERRPNAWAFPRGILALESSAIDAFSDDDIDALRVVVRAFGSLVRLITHDNACLEYRTKLSEAFQAELRDKLPDEETAIARLRKFVFSVKKIDGRQFNKLLDEAIPNSRDSERVWELLKLSQEDIKSLIRFKESILSVKDDEVGEHENANDIVAKRVEWAIDEVEKLVDSSDPADNLDETTGALNQNIVEFLFACTENFQWSAYLSSMAQTLGDRATKSVPKFQMMTPGYSASSMFMASVSQELRQVVKLSEYSKLSKERENYKQYVRYLLVNSARMPVNGFAFDGIGWYPGEEEKKTKKYGALVSDLISAEKNEADLIKTFVTLLCDAIDDPNFPQSLHTQIYHSIRSLFDHGTSLWQQVKLDGQNVGMYVRAASRLPANRQEIKSDKGQKLLHAIAIYCCLYRDCQAANRLQKMMFTLPSRFPRDDDFHSLLYQISHRDLNARNLTWSSALGTFLMIDFEHVGRGYLGHDQTRLWINAICDIYSEAVPERVASDRYRKLFSSIDELITNTSHFLQYLADRTMIEKGAISDYLHHFLGSRFATKSKTKPLDDVKLSDRQHGEHDYFITFFVSLLLNLGEHDGISGLVLYSFYCNALLEFRYSCDDINKKKIDDVVGGLGDLSAASSQDIHNALASDAELNAITKGIYFRHLTAARLLKVTSDALRKLHQNEGRAI